MKKSFYSLKGGAFPKGVRMVLVTDLHAQKYDHVLSALRELAPDYILLGGDILEALDGSRDDTNDAAFGFLSGAAKVAPTFYSVGNHEDGGVHSERASWKKKHSRGMKRSYTEENLKRIKESGVELLIDRYIIRGGIAFGGLASGLILEDHVPDVAFIEAFSRLSEPKVLLCHHPEYYEPYVKNLPIELTLSGHAHGGQWRFFGRGVYAPGQGLFPKYTSGMHEGRFIISKGLKRTFFPPRIFNPTEIVIIDT